MKRKANKGLCNENISHRLGKSDLKIMQKRVENVIANLLDHLDINWHNDHNMEHTPMRVARMLVNETFVGRYMKEPAITDFENAGKMDQLMAIGPIAVKSTCAHHLQPIYGSAWIGVMPKAETRIIGLSKFNRIVDYFARRPQIQEELTTQIANFLESKIKPRGLIVMIKARHFCMCARGVNQESDTWTNVARGDLRDNLSLKQEFFSLIGK